MFQLGVKNLPLNLYNPSTYSTNPQLSTSNKGGNHTEASIPFRITSRNMNVRAYRFHSDDITIEYGLIQKVGADRKVAIALHGFSRTMEDMVAVQPLVRGRALLALHLAGHGRSSGHHRPLEPEDWFSAVEALLASEGLEFDGTLIGYSLGGRIALHWWTVQPERFSRVVLMAPDGLVKSPGYRLAVDTMVGRAWLLQSPRQRERIVRRISWLHAKGLFPDHFYQFSMFHLETAEMWAMVIDCWLSLRRFWPPGRRALKRLVAAHPGVLEAHFGERDKVVKPRNARTLDGVCPVHFHPCGHGLLRPDIVERIGSPS